MLSIIIPIYILDEKLADLTYKCIESIVKYTDDYELIIIDNKPDAIVNGSTSAKEFTCLADIYIANEKNIGNGSAWNQGASLANGKYICFMDNDVEVHKGWAKPLLKILKEDEKVAVAFPLSKNKEDDDYFERLAGFCWVIRKNTFNKINTKIDKGYRIQDWGLANFEDTSFYMSCKLKGYTLKCANNSKVDHYSRATTGKVKEVDELYKHNETKYFGKYKILPMLD
uniref:Putative glycosyltransferase n=1 Tax=viral metagenome TaxID=1070528 RepID=A0A6M3LAC2_9ZZZZ